MYMPETTAVYPPRKLAPDAWPPGQRGELLRRAAASVWLAVIGPQDTESLAAVRMLRPERSSGADEMLGMVPGVAKGCSGN